MKKVENQLPLLNNYRGFIFITIFTILSLEVFSIDKAFVTNKLNLPIVIDNYFLKKSISKTNEIELDVFTKVISYNKGNKPIFTFGDNNNFRLYSNGYLTLNQDTFVIFSKVYPEFEEIWIANFDFNGVKSIENIFSWTEFKNKNEKLVQISFIDKELNIISCFNYYNSPDSFVSTFKFVYFDPDSGNFNENVDTIIKGLELDFILNNLPERKYKRKSHQDAISKYGLPFFLVNKSENLIDIKGTIFYVNRKKQGQYTNIELIEIFRNEKYRLLKRKL